MKEVTFNIKGRLIQLQFPAIMGIINLTPDSYYENSRMNSVDVVLQKVEMMINDGVDIIDIGAESTRSQSTPLTAKEECKRLYKVLPILRKTFPDILISLDTYHSETAKYGIDEGVDFINDISSGLMDPSIIQYVAESHIPYIAMHMLGTPATMQLDPHYENVVKEINYFFSERIHFLHEAGINDIIIDPGFGIGFGKSVDHNYQLLNHLYEFTMHQVPILVGLSRKSMIYKPLKLSPKDTLCATSAIHLQALLNGADILRVHDVKEANHIVQIYKLIIKNTGLN